MESGGWAFYGRQTELGQLQEILSRRRWFFLQISGRRRIGKTTLIQQALQAAGVSKTLYIQIPDSDPAGVVAACNGYLETFGLEERVHSLGELARLIASLAESGYVVALDEFQYFHRKPLFDFCSLLQASLAGLRARSTISRQNPASLRSHEAVAKFEIVAELPNDYLLIEFPPGSAKPPELNAGSPG